METGRGKEGVCKLLQEMLSYFFSNMPVKTPRIFLSVD